MAELEPSYNLKAVVRETRLTPETLRAWERRYGVPNPERTPGGHRLYSLRDIQMLKWLVARQKEGLSISRAVDLWKSLEKEGQNPLERELVEPAPVYNGGPSLKEQRQAWISACMDFNEQEAEAVLTHAFSMAPPEIVVIEVLQKGVAEIGQQWYQGSVSVQQEHFASAQAMRRISALLAAAAQPTRRERILAACPPGEEHEFGLLISAFLLRRRGWPVVYLGANVPLERLQPALLSTRPRLALALAQTLQAAANLREMAQLLHSEGTHLIYGGGIFKEFPFLTSYISGTYIEGGLASVPQVFEEALELPLPEPPKEPSRKFQELLVHFNSRLPLIESDVNIQLESQNIRPAHIRIAHEQLGMHIRAALTFGELEVLENMLHWVQGMLENSGIPLAALNLFVIAYIKALQEHMGEKASYLTEPLLRYTTS
jgi:MerR family transcriptional regulator, light-induced transcriptional regulator